MCIINLNIFDAKPTSHVKRVSNLPDSKPEDPGKRMEPLTGEFTFKTNSMSYLFI